jgi:Zn-dependent peptidase ImmA (M78 family)
MTFPRTARYDYVMSHVNDFFVLEDIKTFPLDPFTIIQKNKWGLVTYTELAKDQGVWIEDIIEAFQSEDGYTIYDGDNYTIAYNDTVSIPGRIKFTLLHEIGHIFLGHLIDFDETILLRSNLNEKKYKVLENEANFFARNALAPVMVVKGLSANKIDDLVKYFEMSHTAAKVRLDALMQDYRKLFAPSIKFQREYFKRFIDTCLNSRKCVKCSHYFVRENAKYCPRCASNRIFKLKEYFVMKYNGYHLKEGRPVFNCPRCHNEEVQQGEYCKVCGITVLNKCTNVKYDFHGEIESECGTLADGDARFCVTCGEKTTYFESGLLMDWKEELEEKREEDPFTNSRKLKIHS